MESLTDLIDVYDTSISKKSDIVFTGNLLKELRKSKIRRPDIVLHCGVKLLRKESGNEVWALYEQLIIAALDIGKVDLADEYLSKLVTKFPDSIRVKRLEGMIMEFEGEYTEALELYATLLVQNPSNILIMKRKISVYKAKGDIQNVINELNSILRLYPSEASSWLELGEIYLSQSAYDDASHCFEELVLLDPHNSAYHTHLAEAYFSTGGADNLLNARKHYTMSLNTQAAKFNLRALYGLMSCCNLIADPKLTPPTITEKKDHMAAINTELLRWAQSQLEDLLRSTADDSPLRVVASSVM